MKNKFANPKNKKYLFLAIFVMVLNISLTVTLLRVSFGQTKMEDFSSQQPVKVEVVEQKDSPLQILVVNVDNSQASFQNIIYSLQNVSSKPVKAFTLIGDGKGSGKIITSFFTAKRFLAGTSEISSFDAERANIAKGETISLSIDYVQFEDGSFWGADSAGKSEEILGQHEGTKAAIKRLNDILTKQSSDKTDETVNFLKQDIGEVVIDVPNTNQSEKWQKGFKLGYRSVISILQRIKGQKVETLLEKLNEIEKISNQGEKQ